MKKIIGIILVLCLLCSGFCNITFATPEITVTVDGKIIEFDVSPRLINDRTMVPLRAIFEALGATVDWDNNTQTVTAYKDGVIVEATIGDNEMFVNNYCKVMDIAPLILGGRTLVPVRFIAEAFDCIVNWREEPKEVEITTYEKEDETVDYSQEQISQVPRHAPNMYVDWIANNEYNSICVDWYCEQDAENTYWAVHNWSTGYAGFQNKDGKHVLLLSLWDLDDGTTPTIEYVLDGQNGDFGGEGTGKQVFTNYHWETETWYSMRIDVNLTNGKTIYTQYIREENSEWLKTASISYPCYTEKFHGSSMFQEDFTFNNLMRRCKLKNACGKIAGSDTWEHWDQCKVSNSYFPTDDATWENGVQNNINFNCDWENYGDAVMVQSGGEGFEEKNKTLPVTYTFDTSADLPENDYNDNTSVNQTISDGIYIIATKLNPDYVLDIDGAGKSNGDNLQLWERNDTPAQQFEVKHLGYGYYHILNVNSNKAIDAKWGGIESGTNVWQYEINDTPAQIWKIVSAENGSFYIINKESGLYLDVDNAYANSGTNVKLFDRNDAYDAQKWYFIKQ